MLLTSITTAVLLLTGTAAAAWATKHGDMEFEGNQFAIFYRPKWSLPDTPEIPLLASELQIYTEAPPSTSPPGQPQAKILPDLCEDRDKLIPRNFTAWDLGLKYEIRLTPGNSCDTGSLKALSKKGNYDNLHVWYGPHLFLDIPTEIRRFEKQQMGRCKNVKKPKGVLCWLPIDG